MKNIKTFYKENKQKIVVGSYIVGAAVIGALAYALSEATKVDNYYKSRDVISWEPKGRFINLEQVKNVLDLNADNSESFAIFREGSESDAYSCILISDNVITDKSEKA